MPSATPYRSEYSAQHALLMWDSEGYYTHCSCSGRQVFFTHIVHTNLASSSVRLLKHGADCIHLWLGELASDCGFLLTQETVSCHCPSSSFSHTPSTRQVFQSPHPAVSQVRAQIRCLIWRPVISNPQLWRLWLCLDVVPFSIIAQCLDDAVFNGSITIPASCKSC